MEREGPTCIFAVPPAAMSRSIFNGSSSTLQHKKNNRIQSRIGHLKKKGMCNNRGRSASWCVYGG